MSSSARAYRILSWLKILLLIFTVIFLITGVVFLATGIYAWMALGHYSKLSPLADIQMTPAVLCAIGGYVIISGLFGFLTAFKNNKCMTNCYCFLLGVVLLSELAGGISAILFMNKVQESFAEGFRRAMNNYNPSFENAIDKAQRDLQCCGANGYKDWFDTDWSLKTSQCQSSSEQAANLTTIPYSCCKTIQTEERNNTRALVISTCYCGKANELKDVNQRGCIPLIFGTKGQTLHYLIAISFGLAAVQIAGIIISICIYRKLRQISLSRRHL